MSITRSCWIDLKQKSKDWRKINWIQIAIEVEKKGAKCRSAHWRGAIPIWSINDLLSYQMINVQLFILPPQSRTNSICFDGLPFEVCINEDLHSSVRFELYAFTICQRTWVFIQVIHFVIEPSIGFICMSEWFIGSLHILIWVKPVVLSCFKLVMKFWEIER